MWSWDICADTVCKKAVFALGEYFQVGILFLTLEFIIIVGIIFIVRHLPQLVEWTLDWIPSESFANQR